MTIVFSSSKKYEFADCACEVDLAQLPASGNLPYIFSRIKVSRAVPARNGADVAAGFPTRAAD